MILVALCGQHEYWQFPISCAQIHLLGEVHGLDEVMAFRSLSYKCYRL